MSTVDVECALGCQVSKSWNLLVFCWFSKIQWGFISAHPPSKFSCKPVKLLCSSANKPTTKPTNTHGWKHKGNMPMCKDKMVNMVNNKSCAHKHFNMGIVNMLISGVCKVQLYLSTTSQNPQQGSRVLTLCRGSESPVSPVAKSSTMLLVGGPRWDFV